MRDSRWRRFGKWSTWSLALAWLVIVLPLRVQGRKPPPVTTLTVVVVDHVTKKPIFQAHLTLEFRDPKSRLGTLVSYSAKTNMEGAYKFEFIPMESVYLIVTAPDHQTLGKTFQVNRIEQVVHLQLRKPQPLR